MADVEDGKTTWDRKLGNDSADIAASMGTCSHHPAMANVVNHYAARHREYKSLIHRIQNMIAEVLIAEKEQRKEYEKTMKIIKGKDYKTRIIINKTPKDGKPNDRVNIVWKTIPLHSQSNKNRKVDINIERCIKHLKYTKHHEGTNGVTWVELLALYHYRKLGGVTQHQERRKRLSIKTKPEHARGHTPDDGDDPRAKVKTSLRQELRDFKSQVRDVVRLTCPQVHQHLFSHSNAVDHRLSTLGVRGHQAAIRANLVITDGEALAIANAIFAQRAGCLSSGRPHLASPNPPSPPFAISTETSEGNLLNDVTTKSSSLIDRVPARWHKALARLAEGDRSECRRNERISSVHSNPQDISVQPQNGQEVQTRGHVPGEEAYSLRGVPASEVGTTHGGAGSLHDNDLTSAFINGNGVDTGDLEEGVVTGEGGQATKGATNTAAKRTRENELDIPPAYKSRLLECKRCKSSIETAHLKLWAKDGYKNIYCSGCKSQHRAVKNLCQCGHIWHQCHVHRDDLLRQDVMPCKRIKKNPCDQESHGIDENTPILRDCYSSRKRRLGEPARLHRNSGTGAMSATDVTKDAFHSEAWIDGVSCPKLARKFPHLTVSAQCTGSLHSSIVA